MTHGRSRFGVRGKLITAMVIVGGIPLVIGMAMALLQGTRELQDMAGANFSSLAAESARTVDLVLSDEVTRTARIARAPLLVERLEAGAARSSPLSAQHEDEQDSRGAAGDSALAAAVTEGPLAEFLRQQVSSPEREMAQFVPSAARAATRALYVTDSRGVVVASNTTAIAYVHREELWWRHAFDNGVGQPFIGTVAFDPRFRTYTFHISLPVMDRIGYRAVGVLHRVLDARDYLAPSVFPIRFGRTGHVMVLDNRGIVVACPILPTGTPLNDATLVQAVTRPEGGWVRAASDGHGGHHSSIIGMSLLAGTSRLMRAEDGRSWHTFVWQASEELSAPTHHFLAWLAGFGVFSLSLLAILGYVASGRIVTPIKVLQQAAARIARGELKTPIAVRTGDELQQLAEEMNRMNAQLELAFRGLTDRVEQKSEEVRMLQVLNQQILDTVPNPILLLDEADHVRYSNQAARRAFVGDGPFLDGKLESILARDPTRGGLGGLMDPAALAREPRDPLAPSPPSLLQQSRHEIGVADRIYRYQWFTMNAQDGRWRGLIFVDVTDERRLEEQVLQAERILGLSRLTSGLGHELNNPLYGVMGLAEAIVDESDPALVKQHAQGVLTEAKRMAKILKDLTTETLAADSGRSPVDVNALIEEALARVPALARIEVRRRLHPLPPIGATPQPLREALVAILTNAAQAMKGCGTIEIRTERTEGDIAIHIRDSGCGIPMAFVSKVFDPFFTTKPQGEGRGLGLTLARQTVERLGGRIRLDSEEGVGTIITIRLPVAVPSPVTGSRSPL